ncbi:MAG: T9SS type A sorting domain-containing protein [Bacteroidetes bacterium]|nr:T9SS type A sorting domain-containing protein [Bacteroidota bacterium]
MEVRAPFKGGLLEITDIYGSNKRVYYLDDFKINISSLPSGCYIWTLLHDNKTWNGKLIKE